MSQSVWKTAIIILCIFQITLALEIVCYNGSLCNSKRVTCTNASELITSGYYDIKHKGVVFVHGYRGSGTSDSTNSIVVELLQLFGFNVCVIDWSKEANVGLIPFVNYPLVVIIVCEIQRIMAECLINWWQNGMNPETIHLIGFSLGAHVVGIAAKIFSKLTNKTIARVTGLDPAGPGYGCPALNDRMDKTNANFVDIIYTDPCKFGMKAADGHVNFYPNPIACKETGVQPGCEPFNLLNIADTCSHFCALNLYVDSLKYKCQLLAAQAPNETTWASPDFIPEVDACIGEDINQTLRGNFYLVTNRQSPYGLKEAGLRASQK